MMKLAAGASSPTTQKMIEKRTRENRKTSKKQKSSEFQDMRICETMPGSVLAYPEVSCGDSILPFLRDLPYKCHCKVAASPKLCGWWLGL